MADVTVAAKVYMKQGGDRLVIASGGKITADGTQASRAGRSAHHHHHRARHAGLRPARPDRHRRLRLQDRDRRQHPAVRRRQPAKPAAPRWKPRSKASASSRPTDHESRRASRRRRHHRGGWNGHRLFPVLTGKLSQIRYVGQLRRRRRLHHHRRSHRGNPLDAKRRQCQRHRRPRQATHTTAGVAALYAGGGSAVLDKIALANDRVKIVIGSGGNAKTGAFHIVMGNRQHADQTHHPHGRAGGHLPPGRARNRRRPRRRPHCRRLRP